MKFKSFISYLIITFIFITGSIFTSNAQVTNWTNYNNWRNSNNAFELLNVNEYLFIIKKGYVKTLFNVTLFNNILL